MYNPCSECFNRYGKSYTTDCDSICEYAYQLSKLKPYGGINTAVEVLKGDAFPVVFLDADHIDYTYKLVCAAKDGAI